MAQQCQHVLQAQHLRDLMETCSQEHARRLHSHEQRAQEQYADEQRWKQLQAAGGPVRRMHHSTKRTTAVRLHPGRDRCMQCCHQQAPKNCWCNDLELLENLRPVLHVCWGVLTCNLEAARCHQCCLESALPGATHAPLCMPGAG